MKTVLNEVQPNDVGERWAFGEYFLLHKIAFGHKIFS